MKWWPKKKVERHAYDIPLSLPPSLPHSVSFFQLRIVPALIFPLKCKSKSEAYPEMEFEATLICSSKDSIYAIAVAFVVVT